MGIQNISGVDFSLITGISGVNIGRLSFISDVRIPPRIVCVDLRLRYDQSIDRVCSANESVYYLDESTSSNQSMGTLYSTCSDRLANIGFYSNGTDIYEWDGVSFITIDRCRR